MNLSSADNIMSNGQQVNKVYSGGQLVWEKQTGYEGFVNINGTWWAKDYLSWTHSSQTTKIKALKPFTDGKIINYYSISAVDYYLSLNSQYRLPSINDFYNLENFLYGYGGLRSMIIPNALYIDPVNSYTINAFSMGLKGTGSFYSGALRDVKVRCCLLTTQPVPTHAQSVIFKSTDWNLGLQQSTLLTKYFAPVRLILNV